MIASRTALPGRHALWIAALLVPFGCARGPELVAPGRSDRPPTPPATQVARAEPAPAPAAPSGPPQLEFRRDDFAEALESARRRGVPLVVDAWAPWCHTCLSMKSYVLSDPALAPLGERAVFVALDTDRPANADFVERYGIEVWPTFLVLDAKSRRVVGMWPGAASLAEFRDFVTRSLEAAELLHRDELSENTPLGKLLDGHVAALARDFRTAAGLYAEAVSSGGPQWERRSDALLGWLGALHRSGKAAECSRVGARHLSEVRGSARPTDFARVYHACVSELKSATEQHKARAQLLVHVQALVEQPPAGASEDDRADTLSLLSELHVAQGDPTAARSADERRLALLERAAERAPSPAAAATYDFARANAYLALGRPEDAIQLLQRREQELPDSYEPPARLASVLHALGRHEPALGAIDRALPRAYGPRQLRYLALKAQILGSLGRTRDQVATLEEEVRGYEALEQDALRPARRDAQERLSQARQKLASE